MNASLISRASLKFGQIADALLDIAALLFGFAFFLVLSLSIPLAGGLLLWAAITRF